VDRLNAGESYIHRIEAQQIRSAQSKGFHATANFSEVGGVDAILICVPTPLSDHHTPDMSYITATIESIVDHLHPGQLVVLESTTYPGTTEELIVPAIERVGNLKVIREGIVANGLLVAYSPETRKTRVNTSIDRRDIPKVVGGLGHMAAEAAAALYNTAFHRVIRVSTPAAAEMTKLLENIYRCVNIALVNELKQLCLRMGIEHLEVIGAAATKPFGFQPFYPGPGWRPLHPHRSLLSELESKGIRLQYTVYRTCRRSERGHAISRGDGRSLCPESAPQTAQGIADFGTGLGVQARCRRSA